MINTSVPNLFYRRLIAPNPSEMLAKFSGIITYEDGKAYLKSTDDEVNIRIREQRYKFKNAKCDFPHITDYNLSDSFFKISFWANHSSYSNYATVICKHDVSDSKRSWWLGFEQGKLTFFSSTNGVDIYACAMVDAVSVDSWNYFEVYRYGDICSFIMNGIPQQINESRNDCAQTFAINTKPVSIGASSESTISLPFSGHMHSVELSKAKNGEIDLFLFAGQSNMVGWDNPRSELPNNLRGAFPVPYAYDIDEYGYSNKSLVYAASNYWGSELQFSNLATLEGKQIAIVKVAKGGSGFGEGHWIKGGEQYEHLVEKTNTMIANLESLGFTVNLKSLIWGQGGNDTRDIDWANDYYDEFITFRTNLMTDISASQLPVILIKTHDDLPTGLYGGRYDYSTVVRAKQELLALLDYVTIVTADDLPLKADGIHYTSAGQIELGNRIYDAAKGLMTNSLNLEKILSCPMNESTTTTCYDVSANKNHGSINNVDTDYYGWFSSFFSLKYGYSLSGDTRIPADPNNYGYDILGNALEVYGGPRINNTTYTTLQFPYVQKLIDLDDYLIQVGDDKLFTNTNDLDAPVFPISSFVKNYKNLLFRDISDNYFLHRVIIYSKKQNSTMASKILKFLNSL